jgi:hypothetical protein
MGKKNAARLMGNTLHKTGRPVDRARVEALCAKLRSLPVLDPRTPDEILGYDAFGIPS